MIYETFNENLANSANDLRVLNLDIRESNILGYADDIAIIEESTGALQSSLDKLTSMISQMGLSINSSKYTTVHIKGGCAECANSIFKIYEAEIPPLKKFEATKYLGKPVGFNIFSNDEAMDDYISCRKNIFTSKLAPWQYHCSFREG